MPSARQKSKLQAQTAPEDGSATPRLQLAVHPTEWRMEPLGAHSYSAQKGYFCAIGGSSTCKNYASKKAFKRHMEEFHGKFCDFLVVRGWPPKEGGQKRNPRMAEQDLRRKDSQDGNYPARVWKAKLNKMIWCCNFGLSRWLLQEKYLPAGTDKWVFIKNKAKIAYDEF
jgi:hypothetical protein